MGKKFDTYLDTVTLRVMDKIGSLEYAVNQRFEEQLLQFRLLEPKSAQGGLEGFKVTFLSLGRLDVWLTLA